ncbi:hypothetical protein SJDPG2_03340 [Porphyromonas gingivalis SJD2]|nr:hypothetical protein SJDPG2_03340 [Porphyromonas gingivalis SJD2]OWR76436.1 hypothetical protein SJDPG5_07705 [Porphyromonas gingivalis SJD5]
MDALVESLSVSIFVTNLDFIEQQAIYFTVYLTL